MTLSTTVLQILCTTYKYNCTSYTERKTISYPDLHCYCRYYGAIFPTGSRSVARAPLSNSAATTTRTTQRAQGPGRTGREGRRAGVELGAIEWGQWAEWLLHWIPQPRPLWRPACERPCGEARERELVKLVLEFERKQAKRILPLALSTPGHLGALSTIKAINQSKHSQSALHSPNHIFYYLHIVLRLSDFLKVLKLG